MEGEDDDGGRGTLFCVAFGRAMVAPFSAATVFPAGVAERSAAGLVCWPRCLRRLHSGTRKLPGLGSRRNRGLSMIHRFPQRGIGARGVLVLRLLGSWRSVPFVCRRLFR